MGFVFIRAEVEDYERWKPVFDEGAAARRDAGSQGGQLFRDAENPNVVYHLLEWDIDRARQFRDSPDLAEKMEEAGVTGPPTIFFMDKVEELSS